MIKDNSSYTSFSSSGGGGGSTTGKFVVNYSIQYRFAPVPCRNSEDGCVVEIVNTETVFELE